MAKKLAARKNRPRKKAAARKEPYTSQRLEAVVDRLREQASKLQALARAMEEDGLDEVVVDGHAMLLRGLNQIDNFSDNASRAVRAARFAKKGI
jgi:hypothetical protein